MYHQGDGHGVDRHETEFLSFHMSNISCEIQFVLFHFALLLFVYLFV